MRCSPTHVMVLSIKQPCHGAALKILSEDTKGGVLSLDSQIPSGLDDNGDHLFKSV